VTDTKIEGFKLRFACSDDTALILGFIRQLAEYENMLDEVEATEEVLKDSLFHKKTAEVLIGEYHGSPVCFALFFHNISTFTGRQGIYLEDLFVKPEFRGKGFGRVMLSCLAMLAATQGCSRVEWSCLDWNEPSRRFYKGLGAAQKDEWIGFRLHKEALNKLAAEF
jgi:GNAT superfamily N-acetyltransferase